MQVLNTKESISTIALAYYDEVTKELKKVTSDNLFFAISSYSITMKRLYLIGDLIYNYDISVNASFVNFDTTSYTTKICMGKELLNIENFNESSHTITGNYETLPFTYLNAIPLDIYIKSNGLVEITDYIDFSINIENISDELLNQLLLLEENEIALSENGSGLIIE